MKYRKLGSTGLEVSALALGGNIFGYSCDAKASADVIHAALDEGINCIDTADVYGNEMSEEFIGRAIKGDRHRWVLATKVGVKSGELPDGKGTRKNIISRLEASLRRLGTDHVDLYQMHHFDPATPLLETLETLSFLQREGKIRYFGVSNYSAEQLNQAVSLGKTRPELRIASMQCGYNLLRRDAEKDILPICRQEGIGAFIYAGLARGVLTGKYNGLGVFADGSRAQKSQNVRNDLKPFVIEAVGRLDDFAKTKGYRAGHLAVSWILRLPQVTTVILGVRDQQQLKDNLKGLDWSLGPADMCMIDTLIGDPAQFNDVSTGIFCGDKRTGHVG